MAGYRLKLVLLAVIAVANMHTSSYATGKHPLSLEDSVKVRRYLDTINSVSIFSLKHQRYFDSALAIAPWHSDWWQQKAMPLYKQKKYEIGAPFLDSAVKYDARSYIDYRGFMKCIFQKSYRQAINDFLASKAIIGTGEVMDHTYDFYLGLSYLQLNLLDSAKYYLTKTTNEQRASMGARYVHPLDLFYLGIVYYQKEDYAHASAAFDSCLKLYTNFSDAKFYKANCLWRLGRETDAKALQKEAGNDFRQGYTINEDNAVYEAYPYQVNKFYFSGN